MIYEIRPDGLTAWRVYNVTQRRNVVTRITWARAFKIKSALTNK